MSINKILVIVTAFVLTASVYAQEDNQASSFFDLVQNGSTAQVRAALAAGADVDARDDNGATALDQVLSNSGLHADMVQVLVNAKADVNLTDQSGVSPLQMALGKKYPAVVIRLLVNAGAVVTPSGKNAPLVTALSAKYPFDTISLLLMKGAKGADANQNGVTPLAAALAGDAKAPVVARR